MKIKFSGWRRSLYDHRRDVHPVRRDAAHTFSTVPRASTLQWADESTAFGKLKDLQLHGDFLVEFSFSDEELENWLVAYFKGHPEKAALLVAKVQSQIFSEIIANTQEESIGGD
jgi:hypothetical protein